MPRIARKPAVFLLALALAGCARARQAPWTPFASPEWHLSMSVPPAWKPGPAHGAAPALGRRDNFGWKNARPVAGFTDDRGPVMSVFATSSTTGNGYPLEGLIAHVDGRVTRDAEPNRPVFRRELIDGDLAMVIDDASTFAPAPVPRLVFRASGRGVYAFVLHRADQRPLFDGVMSTVRFPAARGAAR